jgi:hypothetical protein
MKRALDTWPVWLLTVLSVGGCLAALISFLWAGTAVDLPFTRGRVFTYVRLTIVLITALGAALLFVTWVYVGFQGRRQSIPESPLYPPLLLNSKALSTLLVILAINAYDLLLHNLEPHWSLGRTPIAVLFTNLLLLALLGTKSWTSYQVLRARGWSATILVAIFALLMTVLAIVVVATIAWN